MRALCSPLNGQVALSGVRGLPQNSIARPRGGDEVCNEVPALGMGTWEKNNAPIFIRQPGVRDLKCATSRRLQNLPNLSISCCSASYKW